MVRRLVKQAPASSLNLFTEVKEPTLTSRLFWVQLITYRPFFLVGGFWCAMVCVSAVAYSRLMFTEPPPSGPNPIARAEVLPGPSARALSPAGIPTPVLEPTLENLDPAASASPHQGTRAALWSLVSLVGLCGLGSYLISRQAQAASRRTSRPQRRKKTKRSAPTAALQPSGPKRLSPYSPDRDGVIVRGKTAPPEMPLGPAQSGLPMLPSAPMPAQRPVLPLSTQPGAAPGPQAHQPAVVPASQPHPLDWSDPSLAHCLDLRQRRSLSSLI
ncbi:MAG TPA: hypothetical protein IGR64_10010 [Leptolyngbyaceae cyanobacterium M65_K2018_010]|nr:hypothetical protein [Leptolyngbyaceae cyanobacterium M65_K2018_010]